MLPNRRKYEKLLKSIIESIHISVLSKELTINSKEALKFSELTGLSIEDHEVYRKLAALLILNRLRFIVLSQPKGISLDQMTLNIIEKLKKQHSNLFVSSILEKIALNSTFHPTLEELNFIKKDGSDKIMATLFTEILSQNNRRKLGQFWTPAPIADVMVDLLFQGKIDESKTILDPCTGTGIFLQKISQLERKLDVKIGGIEIHPLLYEIAQVNSYSERTNIKIVYSDFLTIAPVELPFRSKGALAVTSGKDLSSILQPIPSLGYHGIICNPPYSRHHILPKEIKDMVGDEFERTFGGKFSRISSQFMYFIIKALKLLIRNGRMVFITPTIAFESRNSQYLKEILRKRFQVPYIIVFHHRLNVFEGVDTSACIFVIDGNKPKHSDRTRLIIINDDVIVPLLPKIVFQSASTISKWAYRDAVKIYETKQTSLDPKLNWTQARSFSLGGRRSNEVPLSRFFHVMRGIATGRNEYFVLTDAERRKYKLSKRFLVPTITKTRLVQKYVLTRNDFNRLSNQNKKVWLLYIQGDISLDKLPTLRNYLQHGESTGVPNGSLVKSRKIWYQLEKREIPVLLFTYLSRGASRFILNNADVRPLNSFLMLYPQPNIDLSSRELRLLWVILNSNETRKAMRETGRTYGGDTLKVEPRELMMTPILNPSSVSAKVQAKLVKFASELEVSTVKEAQKECLPAIDSIVREELSQ
ncbi:MAG: class I SAM-dependent DNA methyltransferase [Candidatus Thorarchaeota archaeon]